MENDGPNTPGGEEEADPAANVVHFPRDWFGPREELVPFGPRASGEVAEEPRASVPSPVRAEDFWGEESASIHNAMAGPGAVAEAGAVEAVEDVREPAPRRLVRGIRALAPRLSVPRPQVHLPRPRLHGPHLTGRPVVVAAGVAAACLLAASVVGSLWSRPVPVAHGGHDAATLSPAVIAPAMPPITSARTEGRAPSRRRIASHGRPARPGHTRGRASRARESTSSGSHNAAQAVVASTSSSSSVESSTPSDAGSGAGTGGASSGTSSGNSATPASASSGSSGGGSSQSSGPVGPGAPFGPGHLG